MESRTPRRAPARIALHTSPVPYQREVPTLPAHFALIALCLSFGAPFRLARRGLCRGASAAPLQRLQLLRRRQIVLGFLLQRGGAFQGVGGAGGGERHHVAAAMG